MESTNIANVTCLHCNAAVSQREVADGWCDSCGKRLPTSVQPTKSKLALSPLMADAGGDLPEVGRGTWVLICGVAAFAVLSLATLFALAG